MVCSSIAELVCTRLAGAWGGFSGAKRGSKMAVCSLTRLTALWYIYPENGSTILFGQSHHNLSENPCFARVFGVFGASYKKQKPFISDSSGFRSKILEKRKEIPLFVLSLAASMSF